MSSKPGDKSLDIAIMGRTYKVNCADEERESLLQAAAYLDQKMNEIRDRVAADLVAKRALDRARAAAKQAEADIMRGRWRGRRVELNADVHLH